MVHACVRTAVGCAPVVVVSPSACVCVSVCVSVRCVSV